MTSSAFAPSPTDEQLDILAFVAGDTAPLLISALAGTGKTNTLERILAETHDPALYLAFNKRNAKEAESRLPPNVQCRTLNGVGYRIWAIHCPHKLTLDDSKDRDWLRNAIKTIECDREERSGLWENYGLMLDAVKHAKTVGYIPWQHRLSTRSLLTPAEFEEQCGMHDLTTEMYQLVTQMVEGCLLASIKAGHLGRIDFADQIYLPTLFGGNFPRFPLILVDEVQDLNPLNHVMVSKLVSAGSARLIAVGDPNQNIYQFRGAHASGMESLRTTHRMHTLPLTISFRCPSAIVDNVHWHVPEFRAFRTGGNVSCPDSISLSSFAPGSAILCRNNAPLIALALRFLSASIPVEIAGRDIAARLVATLRKLGPESLPQRQVLTAISEWRSKTATAQPGADDLADCMMALAAFGDNLAQAIAYAEHIFTQRGPILLSTGHKAKGLEWPLVYHLDSFLDERAEDANLRYVIQTRSSDRLVEVYSDRITDA